MKMTKDSYIVTLGHTSTSSCRLPSSYGWHNCTRTECVDRVRAKKLGAGDASTECVLHRRAFAAVSTYVQQLCFTIEYVECSCAFASNHSCWAQVRPTIFGLRLADSDGLACLLACVCGELRYRDLPLSGAKKTFLLVAAGRLDEVGAI